MPPRFTRRSTHARLMGTAPLLQQAPLDSTRMPKRTPEGVLNEPGTCSPQASTGARPLKMARRGEDIGGVSDGTAAHEVLASWCCGCVALP